MAQDNPSLARVVDDLYDLPGPQAHGGQIGTIDLPTFNLPDEDSLPGFGHAQRNEVLSFRQTCAAQPVNVHPVLKHVKAVPCGNLCLKPFDIIIGKFRNLPTFRADQVVVVLSKVPVFITDGLAFKALLLSKTQIEHPVHALLDEFGLKRIALFSKKLNQFFQSNVLFGFQKSIDDVQAILQPICAIGLDEGFEIKLFQLVIGH